jgi:hypothetical protein
MFNDDVYIALLLGYLLHGETVSRGANTPIQQKCSVSARNAPVDMYSRSTISLSTEDTETLMSSLWYRRITEILRKCEYVRLCQLKEYPKSNEKMKYIV